jgi:hypothetical protein
LAKQPPQLDSATVKRVKKLVRRGWRNWMIADDLGLTSNHIGHIVTALRRAGKVGRRTYVEGRNRCPEYLKVEMTKLGYGRLMEAARGKQMTMRQLAQEIVTKVVVEDLIDAVLDDGRMEDGKQSGAYAVRRVEAR